MEVISPAPPPAVVLPPGMGGSGEDNLWADLDAEVAALSGVGADAKLSDVEDHLDDVTRDFSNAELLP